MNWTEFSILFRMKPKPSFYDVCGPRCIRSDDGCRMRLSLKFHQNEDAAVMTLSPKNAIISASRGRVSILKIALESSLNFTSARFPFKTLDSAVVEIWTVKVGCSSGKKCLVVTISWRLAAFSYLKRHDAT